MIRFGPRYFGAEKHPESITEINIIKANFISFSIFSILEHYCNSNNDFVSYPGTLTNKYHNTKRFDFIYAHKLPSNHKIYWSKNYGVDSSESLPSAI